MGYQLRGMLILQFSPKVEQIWVLNSFKVVCIEKRGVSKMVVVVSIEYGTLAIEVGLVFNFAFVFCRRISFPAKYKQLLGGKLFTGVNVTGDKFFRGCQRYRRLILVTDFQ
jgi:hypothetical protein